jgi:alanine racemase
VKADGYGHGAVEVGRAALEAGASLLAVALVEEGAVLRDAGIDAPVLLLSEPPLDDLDEVVRLDLQPTLYRIGAVAAAGEAARRAGVDGLAVHLKVDTGMHRVGVAPADALELAQRIVAEPGLRLEGLSTHCAVADEPAHPFTDVQLDRFQAVLDDLERAGVEVPVVHAANSAATLVRPDARFDLVRCGIAIYGLDPSPALHGRADLRPALAVKAAVSYVKRVAAGEAVSYGLRYPLATETVIATVPIGYADGVRRSLGAQGGEVLIGGRRRRIAGTVTMDQITVDCGDDDSVAVGDEVVLVGVQGDEVVTVADWAAAAGTIPYEIACGIGPRLPRHYLR